MNIGDFPRHRPTPLAKTAVLIDGFDPGVQVIPFDLVLLAVLPLHFENQGLAVAQANQEIREEFAANAIEQVEDVKAQMVIFGVGVDQRAMFQGIGFRRFPGAVKYRMAQM